MRNDVYKQLEELFKNKVNKSDELFNKFCYNYIIETVNDSDILEVLNQNNRDVNISIVEYFKNDKILIRAIKVLTLLELSKDFKEFNKYDKILKKDKDIIIVKFDEILKKFMNK
ncbi:hypothetical protein [Flavobacterium lindanitolerans]|uniref:Uncharacterized protein n=1 Tax=Flavobacterium lindanitolerans TaxID=428988 RepID=A0A497VCY5_9FLAO|nr:hypothetical protein [Flavobacterium lindanitolerans]MBC8643726.1 hypothetical protein [Flavobacterium lindanitolerans]PKW28466.1 hypothetical protein B0G92_0086 [Flavobacterium lindanitolerans]RLJ36029.1 hypothetical protein CLV50_1418 [Flavobacterium lindanitolerans]